MYARAYIQHLYIFATRYTVSLSLSVRSGEKINHPFGKNAACFSCFASDTVWCRSLVPLLFIVIPQPEWKEVATAAAVATSGRLSITMKPQSRCLFIYNATEASDSKWTCFQTRASKRRNLICKWRVENAARRRQKTFASKGSIENDRLAGALRQRSVLTCREASAMITLPQKRNQWNELCK